MARLRDLRARNVLVTGASSGIGRAVALRCAAAGAHLHLTDIAADGLEGTADAIRAAGGSVPFVAAADVADHDAVQQLAARLQRERGSMDVVMNVAGVSTWGTVRSLDHRRWRRMVDVNLMGPIHVIETLVPPMIDAGRGGWLVNVSSAAGIIGLPWHAAYSASKFGVRGVSEVLRFDLRRHGIGVSLVCPGGVDTGLVETIDIAGVDRTTPTFRRLQARFRGRAVSADAAAEAIVAGMLRGRYWIYTSRDVQLVHLVQRWCPPLYVSLMRAMHAVANRALPAVDEATRDAAREEVA